MWKRLTLIWSLVRGDAKVAWHAFRHPHAPGWFRAGVIGLGLYLFSPVDLIPDILPLLGLADLRSVVSYLTSDEGKPELKELGGVSSASAGVAHRAAAIARAVKRIGVRIRSPWAKHGCCPLGSTKNRGRAGLTRFGASATAPA